MRFVSNNEEMSLLRTLPVIAFFSTKTLDEEIWARALVGDSVLLSSAIAAGMFKGRCVGGTIFVLKSLVLCLGMS
ncbi:hypothetical protein D3C72_1396150 [compost metagenome]